MALLHELLSHLDLSTTSDVDVWSDVGTHYRSYRVVGTYGTVFPEQYRKNSHYNYGPESLCGDGQHAQGFHYVDHSQN